MESVSEFIVPVWNRYPCRPLLIERYLDIFGNKATRREIDARENQEGKDSLQPFNSIPTFSPMMNMRFHIFTKRT
jgi:hypothetical protein